MKKLHTIVAVLLSITTSLFASGADESQAAKSVVKPFATRVFLVPPSPQVVCSIVCIEPSTDAIMPESDLRQGLLKIINTNIGNRDPKFLVSYIRGDLKEIYLSKTSIGPKVIKIIAPYFPASLEYILLSRNMIGDDGVIALVPHLKEGLKHLYLRYNNIGDPGIIALANRLKRNPIASLKNIYLDGNEEIGKEGYEALNEAGYIQSSVYSVWTKAPDNTIAQNWAWSWKIVLL